MESLKKPHGILLPHLTAWRESQFLSQGELAKLARVSRSAISDAEQGRYMRLGNARKLAEALKISPRQLLAAPDQEREKAGAVNG